MNLILAQLNELIFIYIFILLQVPITIFLDTLFSDNNGLTSRWDTSLLKSSFAFNLQ